MALELKETFPPCIKYSGKDLYNKIKDKSTNYDGSNHLSLAYKIYRWFDGKEESETEFIKLYSEWHKKAGHLQKYYFDINNNIDKAAKDIASAYNKKVTKNPEYANKGCLNFVSNSGCNSKLCYLCPLSSEYVNARIEYEKIVLGCALVNMNVDFFDIFYKDATPENIFYENLAVHFTGTYPQFENNEICEYTYNFHALLAYYLAQNAKEINKGHLNPTLKLIKDNAACGTGAFIQPLMNNLKIISYTLGADGSAVKRNSDYDYSCPLSTSDMIHSFNYAVEDIISAGLNSSYEEYNNAVLKLNDIYSYSDFYKKNALVGKTGRYMSMLGVGRVDFSNATKKVRPKKNRSSKKNNLQGQTSVYDLFNMDGTATNTDMFSGFLNLTENNKPDNNTSDNSEQGNNSESDASAPIAIETQEKSIADDSFIQAAINDKDILINSEEPLMYTDDNIENQDNPINDNEAMCDSTELATELNSNDQAITLIEPSFKLVSGYTVPDIPPTENPKLSVYEISHIPIDDDSFGNINFSYGLSEKEAINTTAKCLTDIQGTEPIAVEYAYNKSLNVYGILFFSGKTENFWYVLDESYNSGNILWKLFTGKRVKICINYPAIMSYLSKRGIKATNLISLSSMYCAINNPDRIIVNDIFANSTHSAKHQLKHFMLNYIDVYNSMNDTMNDTDSRAYKKIKTYDEAMAYSYDLSDVTSINSPGIDTLNYTSLSYSYIGKECLRNNPKYCLITAAYEKSSIPGISETDILDKILDRISKGHIYSKYNLRILKFDSFQLTLVCPGTNLYQINDIIIDILKKSCRDCSVNTNIIPTINISNEKLNQS